jgi:hypothetical protein
VVVAVAVSSALLALSAVAAFRVVVAAVAVQCAMTGGGNAAPYDLC